MDRQTRVHHIESSSCWPLGDLLDMYGEDITSKLFGKMYVFEYKYECNGLFRANINRGRPPHHINKINGRLKYKYKNSKLKDVLFKEFSKIQIYPKTTLISAVKIIEKFYKEHLKYINYNVIVIQKYIRSILTRKAFIDAKNMLDCGMDFKDDPITCDTISKPVIILTDWEMGNKVIYDYKTIENFLKIRKEPIYWYQTRTSETHYVYRYVYEVDFFGYKIYKSPMTREKFTINEVIEVEDKLWYKVGKAIQSNVT